MMHLIMSCELVLICRCGSTLAPLASSTCRRRTARKSLESSTFQKNGSFSLLVGTRRSQHLKMTLMYVNQIKDFISIHYNSTTIPCCCHSIVSPFLLFLLSFSVSSPPPPPPPSHPIPSGTHCIFPVGCLHISTAIFSYFFVLFLFEIIIINASMRDSLVYIWKQEPNFIPYVVVIIQGVLVVN